MSTRERLKQETLTEKLLKQLDASILDLSRAIYRDPLPNCPPEEEEWAATTQTILVASVLSQTTGGNTLSIARERMNELIEKDPENHQRLSESDIYSESFDDPELIKLIVSDTVETPRASGDPAEDVAQGLVMTKAFRDTSRKIDISQIEINC